MQSDRLQELRPDTADARLDKSYLLVDLEVGYHEVPSM